MFEEKIKYNRTDILTGLAGTGILTSILLVVTAL